MSGADAELVALEPGGDETSEVRASTAAPSAARAQANVLPAQGSAPTA